MLLFGLSELTLSHQCVVGFCFRCAFRLRGYWTTGRPPSASFFSCFTRAPPVGCSYGADVVKPPMLFSDFLVGFVGFALRSGSEVRANRCQTQNLVTSPVRSEARVKQETK
jgi:hypothetical protein